MSRISSPVSEVRELLFHCLPTRKKIKMVAAVRVDQTIVFLSARGNVYSTQVKANCYYVGGGLEDTVTGCRLLGLLSKEAVAKHEACKRKERERIDHKYAAEYLVESAKTLGVDLTPSQLKAVAAASGAGK